MGLWACDHARWSLCSQIAHDQTRAQTTLGKLWAGVSTDLHYLEQIQPKPDMQACNVVYLQCIVMLSHKWHVNMFVTPT